MSKRTRLSRRGDNEPDILFVYPEGNDIRASDERPFLQIGETTYGELPLELAVEARAGLVTGLKVAIGFRLSPTRAWITSTGWPP